MYRDIFALVLRSQVFWSSSTQIFSYLVSKYNLFWSYKAIIRYHNYKVL